MRLIPRFLPTRILLALKRIKSLPEQEIHSNEAEGSLKNYILVLRFLNIKKKSNTFPLVLKLGFSGYCFF
jgi:hypothetical protein